GEIRAYVVDRDELNSQLIRKARDAGVEVRNPVFWEGLQSERVSQVKDLRAGDRKRIRSEVIIGADGPHSKIREQLELPSPQKMLFSIQGLARSPSLNPKMVEVHFGREIAPDFFGWVVPLGSREARFGLASTSREGLKRRLRLLLKKKSVSELISLSAGPIPIGIPSRCSVAGNLLVGDAAAQVKPTTGGGIYPGSKCALIAGSLAAKQVKGENRRPLSSIYRNRWMDMVGSELEREMKLHKILAGLDDSALNILLHLCKNKEVKSLLRDHGDVDHLSRSAKAVLSNAPLLSTFLKRLPAQLGDFAGDYLSEVLR
ncbi:MAG: FAD-dependent monooxygenase, partial [Candidatus Acetothermia bacterium]